MHLIVPDVGRSIARYERALGLVAHRREASEAEAGGFDSVVVLHEDQLARAPGRHAGLYHYALPLPDRRALAHAAMRLALTDTPVHGARDHVWRGRGIGAVPPHTVGLSFWTLLLSTEADVLAVRVRLDAAGLRADAAEGGFVTHDPWENAVVLRNEGGTQ